MGAQGRRRLSGVGRGASVSLTADRRKQLSGMDAAQIEGHHLWREFLGAVSDQFSMGRFALPTHDFISELASYCYPATRCVCTKDPFQAEGKHAFRLLPRHELFHLRGEVHSGPPPSVDVTHHAVLIDEYD